MKIAIEGMDGVGKTTVAKAFAQKNDFLYIDKPLHYLFNDKEDSGYKDLMDVANNIYKIKDPVIRSWFFGLGNIFCFRNFDQQDFIVDRHFVSNYFWNGDSQSDKVFELMLNIVGVPDLTIVLYASPEVRMKRLMKRNPNDEDIFDPQKMVNGYDKMIKFMEIFKIPYALIDTENKSVDEVVMEIEEIIEKSKRKKTKVIKKVY